MLCIKAYRAAGPLVLAPPCGHKENSPIFQQRLSGPLRFVRVSCSLQRSPSRFLPRRKRGGAGSRDPPQPQPSSKAQAGVEVLTALAWARVAWHPKWVTMTAMKNSRMVKMVSTAR